MNRVRIRESRGPFRFRWLGAGVMLTAFGLSACAVVNPAVSAMAPERPGLLLGEIREITRREGLTVATRRLVERLEALDDSGGTLESRVIRTTKDPGLILPDSLAAMPRFRRQKTVIAIIPGTRAGNRSGKDRTRECLRGAEAECQAMGFSTYFVETEPRGTIERNAELVSGQMRDVFAASDTVVFLMLSKGAHDVIAYLQQGGVDLPASHRKKLVAVISLAGTVQGSVVADWLASSNRPIAASTRAWLRFSGQSDAIEMLHSIGDSPWRNEVASKFGNWYPRLVWVSIAMVPDGPDGRITDRLWSPIARRLTEKYSPYYSPTDGLVESAASVLPETVTVPQWIIAAYGSHAMPNGTYRDGSRIAPQTTEAGREKLKPETGGEVISAYLRALPRSLAY